MPNRTQIEAEIAKLEAEIGDVRRSQPLRSREMIAARERRIEELRAVLAKSETA